MYDFSPEQVIVLAKLEKRGFRENRIDKFGDEPWPTVYMSKRVNRYSSVFAEVGPDASVNGKSDVDAEIASLLS